MNSLPRLAFGNSSALQDSDVRAMNDRIQRHTGFDISYHVADASTRFRHRSSVASINGLSIVATASTPLYVEVKDAEHPALLVPLSGNSFTTVEKVRYQWNAGEAAILLPATARRGHDTKRSALFITIDKQRIETTARSMLGPDAYDNVDFLSLYQPRTLAMRTKAIDFNTVFRHYGELIDQFASRPDLLGLSGIDEACYRTIVMMLLPKQFAVLPGIGRKEPNVLSNQRVNELCEYILANLERTVTMTELESVSGVSARSLQYAFRRRFNCTPGQWIVEQKLLAVHSRLLNEKLDESITQTAIHFFVNLGDFSRKYRHRFGELPSQTLARVRG